MLLFFSSEVKLKYISVVEILIFEEKNSLSVKSNTFFDIVSFSWIYKLSSIQEIGWINK